MSLDYRTYLEALKQRLASQDFSIKGLTEYEDIRFELVAIKHYLSVDIFHNCYLMKLDKVEPKTVWDVVAAAHAHARSARVYIFGNALVFPVLCSSNVSQEAKEYVTSFKGWPSPTHRRDVEHPVLVDLSSGEMIHFTSKPRIMGRYAVDRAIDFATENFRTAV